MKWTGIKKYQSDLHNDSTQKLVYEKVKRVQNIIDKRLKIDMLFSTSNKALNV